MSRKIAFTSLGCDKNRVDSEVMLGILQKNGYTAGADEAEAGILVVNPAALSRMHWRKALKPLWRWPNIRTLMWGTARD